MIDLDVAPALPEAARVVRPARPVVALLAPLLVAFLGGAASPGRHPGFEQVSPSTGWA